MQMGGQRPPFCRREELGSMKCPKCDGDLVYFELQSHTWELDARGRLAWDDSEANCIETGVECRSCGASCSFARVDCEDDEHAEVRLK